MLYGPPKSIGRLVPVSIHVISSASRCLRYAPYSWCMLNFFLSGLGFAVAFAWGVLPKA